MATLPEFLVLQSKPSYDKYVQFLHQEGDLHGFLQSSGDKVVSPYTKLQVEVSQTDNNLVHLRNCYNNKYWLASSEENNLICAGADVPEEDQSKLSCTLFRPTFDGDAKTVGFSHVNLGKFITLFRQPDQPNNACLYPGSSSPELGAVFTVIDWSSLTILPRNVGFKNWLGTYLSARPTSNNVRYLQFVDDNVISDPTVAYEVHTANDANILLKSDHYGTFWNRTTSDLILCNASESDVSSDSNTWFTPQRISPDNEYQIALLNVGNNKYCTRNVWHDVTTDEPMTTLRAVDATTTVRTLLEVRELVNARKVKIETSDFRSNDLRSPGAGVATILTKEVTNPSSETVAIKVKLVYYKTTFTRTWNSTVNGSLKVGFNVYTDSPTPRFEDGDVTMGDTKSTRYVWGSDDVVSLDPVEEDYQVTLPPMYKATVKVLGVYQLWDIPFSYVHTNTLKDGTESSFRMDDGVYTGTDTQFLDYKVDETPINS